MRKKYLKMNPLIRVAAIVPIVYKSKHKSYDT